MKLEELARLRNEAAFLAPPSFDIELTNLCNLRCRFCPREAITRPMGMMSGATFEDLLANIPKDGELYFCGIGEPLLHPKAVEFVRRSKTRGHRSVTLVTNAALLTPDVTRVLLDAGLDTLQVSFNGVTPEVYERMMVGGRFERALAHVDAALSLGRGRLRVQILATETKLNRAECDRLAEFWGPRGVSDVVVTACHSRGGFLHDDELYDYQAPPALPICGILAAVTFVAWTGEVLACCQDLPGACVLGNLAETDYAEILLRKRALVSEGRLFPMCAECNTERRYTMLHLRWTGDSKRDRDASGAAGGDKR